MLSVRQKILVARGLNLALGAVRRPLGLGMRTVARRCGVTWDLDLDEGIDLSIYALGAYEPLTYRCYHRILRPGMVVFDIGANIGAHTLHFANLVGASGRVHAFEPTDYAMTKLRRNLQLNPSLAGRIALQKAFLVGEAAETPPDSICSSWPLSGRDTDLDDGHQGKHKPIGEVQTFTGDAYCAAASVERLDFMKIDVDGFELSVLQGFRRTLERHQPTILIELAPFIYTGDKASEFEDMLGFLSGLGYTMTRANSGRPLPSDAASLRRGIVDGASINALLIPTRTASRPPAIETCGRPV